MIMRPLPYISDGKGDKRWPYVFRPLSLAADWYSGVVRRDEIGRFDADTLNRWLRGEKENMEIATPERETSGLWICYTVYCTPSATASPEDFKNKVITTIKTGIDFESDIRGEPRMQRLIYDSGRFKVTVERA